jgi:integrase
MEVTKVALEIKQPRKGSPKLWLGGTYRGIRVREATDFYPGQEVEAEAVLARKKAEIDKIVDAEEKRAQDLAAGNADWRQMLFEDACLDYLRTGGKAQYLGYYDKAAGRYVSGLLAHFHGYRLGQITSKLVFDKIDEQWPPILDADGKIVGQSAKNATKNRNFIVPLLAVFRASDGAVPPFKKLKEEAAGTRSAAPEEVHDMLRAVATPKPNLPKRAPCPHLHVLLMVLPVSGRRISELLVLPREALQKDGSILLRTKNGDPFLLYLPDFLVATIRALPPAKNGRLFGYKTRHSVYDTLKRHCAWAGVTYLPPHQLGRHTFAMTALRAGMSLKQIQVAGGWRTLTALDRYLKLMKKDEQIAASAVVSASLGMAGEPDTMLTQCVEDALEVQENKVA